jgi:hypothetical protein
MTLPLVALRLRLQGKLRVMVERGRTYDAEFRDGSPAGTERWPSWSARRGVVPQVAPAHRRVDAVAPDLLPAGRGWSAR